MKKILFVIILFSSVSLLAQKNQTKTAKTEEPGSFTIRQSEDASIDRNIFTPTAETLRSGEVAINCYEILFWGVSVGLTDNFQASIATIFPITPEVSGITINGKWKLYESKKTIASTFFGGTYTRVIDDGNLPVSWAPHFGLAVDHFASNTTVITFSNITIIPMGHFGSSDWATAFTGSFNFRISKNVKFMLELSLPLNSYQGKLSAPENTFLISYGIRFYGKSLALDLSLIRPIYDGFSSDDPSILGYPYLAVTARI